MGVFCPMCFCSPQVQHLECSSLLLTLIFLSLSTFSSIINTIVSSPLPPLAQISQLSLLLFRTLISSSTHPSDLTRFLLLILLSVLLFSTQISIIYIEVMFFSSNIFKEFFWSEIPSSKILSFLLSLALEETSHLLSLYLSLFHSIFTLKFLVLKQKFLWLYHSKRGCFPSPTIQLERHQDSKGSYISIYEVRSLCKSARITSPI